MQDFQNFTLNADLLGCILYWKHGEHSSNYSEHYYFECNYNENLLSKQVFEKQVDEEKCGDVLKGPLAYVEVVLMHQTALGRIDSMIACGTLKMLETSQRQQDV